MQIKDVTVDTVRSSPSPQFNWRDGLPPRPKTQHSAFLRISTDEGIDGRAMTSSPAIVSDIVDRRLRADLVGRDPLQRELLWHRMWEIDRAEEMPWYAFGLVDIALWDLAGKVTGLPVHRLLGNFRTAIPAYASTVTFDTPQEYLDVVDQCLELGYSAIKLHAWGDARRDAALAQAVRDRVGPDVSLMYDGSAGFDLPDAIYVGYALAEAGFLWYEEPITEYSVSAYKLLAERVDVPLLVAESTGGAHLTTADFIAAKCATFVRTSAHRKGGITGAMRIAHLADAFRLRAEVHGPGLPNQHLCMAISNTTYYESLVTSNPVQREAVLTNECELPAPTAPGIGWEDVA